ncbi:MAG: FtsQ-type POTRA domain-containing protein [Nitrospiraceae bacterium]|nr:FtsQ-type POTRA domain-containing protein [Nitrospiraceae bacterium]
MRDYKYVKAPKSGRGGNRRTITRRVDAGPVRGGRRTSVAGMLKPFLALVLAAGLGYGGWEAYRWLTHAELFEIAGVDMKGIRRLSDDEVKAIAGLFTKKNIFRVDLGEAQRRALANPWVKEARVERSLPNRVSIVFTERTPRAVLAAANGRFLIDIDGVVIVPQGQEATADLPTVAVRDWRAAPRNPVTTEAAGSALELLQELDARGGWDRGGVTVRADAPESITIVYADHEFRVGTGNYPEKLRRIGEVVSDMNRRELAYAYVDVRADRQVAVLAKRDSSRGPGTRGQGKRR